MEIRNINQYQQNTNTPSAKGKPDNTGFFNTADTFKPSTPDSKPPLDLKKATKTLFRNEVNELWENGESGVVYAANGKRVVMGGFNTEVKAVDPNDGTLLWKSKIRGFIQEGKDGILYAAGGVKTETHIDASGAKSVTFAGERGGKSITALDPSTGKEIWHEDFPSEIRIFKIADDGTLFVRSEDKVLAVDPKTRKITGECKVPGEPAIGKNGMVFAGGPFENKLYAYDIKTGKKKWKVKTEGVMRSTPTVGKDGTVFVGMWASDSMIALDPETGKQKWSFKAGGDIVLSPVVGEDGTVYLGDCGKPSHLYAIDPDTGKQKWSFEGRDGFKGGISFLPDGTITASAGRYLYAINPDNGRTRWSMTAKSEIFNSPVTGTEGRLYFGTKGQGMHCITDSVLQGQGWEKTLANNEIAREVNLQITMGNGFIDIGGVKLKVNK